MRGTRYLSRFFSDLIPECIYVYIIQHSSDLQDYFLNDLSLQIGKLQRHQARFSGFETAIRLEVTLRENWKTRARNYGQLKKGIKVDYDIDEEALAGKVIIEKSRGGRFLWNRN